MLVTGRGTSGSWQIRGVQLGKAIGAHVEAEANSVKGFDVAVVVKRVRGDLLERLKQRSVPIVWDIVDAWPQPIGNMWNKAECMAWLRAEVKRVRPAAIVAPTIAMLQDCAEFSLPAICIPHHARPGLVRNKINPRVRWVGYEGGANYLGKWAKYLEDHLLPRDVEFVVNPASIDQLDIVVAVREQCGYAPMHWKSNVKLANAQGSGTPCILARECGYLETASGGEKWADNEFEMEASIGELWTFTDRLEAAEKLYASRLTLDNVAAGYEQWLSKQSF